MDNSKIFIVGANGQLGTALKQKYPNAKSADIGELDITDQSSVENFDWSDINTILNVAAYTNVDGAETAEGRVTAWKVNADAVANLAAVAAQKDMTLVHISTDYVFDGTQSHHTEDEPLSPLSVYGASKAAGDLIVSMLPKHFILRTSWVIGEGNNFVRTMLEVGAKGTNPTVVADQIGRLTFTGELVRAIDHLLTSKSSVSYGTYNVSNEGESLSWADITREIFKIAGLDLKVTDISTKDYYHGQEGIAPRPLNSTLDLSRLHSTGFTSRNWEEDLNEYINREPSQ